MTTETTRVLYVDTDATRREEVTTALGGAEIGMAVASATDMAETIGYLENHSVDCLVSAHALADGTGVDLLRTVRERFPTLPYILFAEDLSDERVRAAIDAGVTEYLPRDSDDTRCSLLVDRILAVISQHDETARTRDRERMHTVARNPARESVHASTPDDGVTEWDEHERELERYKYLWKHLPVGAARFNSADDNRFVTVNHRLVEITGARSETELLDRSIAELWYDRRAMETFLERVVDEGQATTTAQFETLGGDHIWVRIIAFYRESVDGSAIDIVVQDITDLRKKEIHLEEANEVADIGWWQTDIPSDQIYWSRQIYDMWGTDGDVGLIDHDTFLSFIHPEDRAHVDEQWDAAKRGEPYDIEHRIITGDGELRWMREKADLTFDESGEPVSAVGIVQDITAQKTRERQLEHRTEQYEAVIENIHDGLVIIQDGIIQFANPRITELTGYPTDELVGEPIVDFISEEYRQTIFDRYQARLEDETPTDTYQIEIYQRDGELLPVELSVGIFDYEGQPATITAIRDISDRIDRTQQLRVLDRVLRHNLRNDMATITGYAETIKAESEQLGDAADMILKRSEKFMRTVEKEREIVETIAEQPKREAVDLADICQRVVAATREDHPDANITLDSPAEASAIATEKIGRGIEELLTNAIVHNDRDVPDVSLAVDAHQNTVRVDIADNGPGIPEAERNVLTREYEVAPLYHGSGLGLWLVNWIVKRSGGTLSFEANDPRGSIITIEL